MPQFTQNQDYSQEMLLLPLQFLADFNLFRLFERAPACA